MQKIKDTHADLKKPETNFNCNLGENNFIFINISRGSSIINNNNNNLENINNDNNNENNSNLERFESTTPKMMIDKSNNLEEVANGNKKLFSHFCKNRMSDINGVRSPCHRLNNQIITSPFIIHTLDMNKYCEEMLNVINSIRVNPESFISFISSLENNNIQKTSEGIFLISHEIEEKIKLVENYMELFEKAKDALKKKSGKSSKLERLKYNYDLEIILDENNNSLYEFEYEDEENDIKNIPAKLNMIFDDSCIIDDGLEEENETNKVKFDAYSNIIDFDLEDNKSETEKSNLSIIQLQRIDNNSINKKKIIKRKVKPREKVKNNINAYLDLNDDKIANLILDKRKEIKYKYPLNIFKISVIKDIRISLFIQIAMEEISQEKNRKSLIEIIFEPKYKNFAVSWTNEVNRNFISISCFA